MLVHDCFNWSYECFNWSYECFNRFQVDAYDNRVFYYKCIATATFNSTNVPELNVI